MQMNAEVGLKAKGGKDLPQKRAPGGFDDDDDDEIDNIDENIQMEGGAKKDTNNRYQTEEHSSRGMQIDQRGAQRK